MASLKKRAVRFWSILNLWAPPASRAPPHNINYQGSSRFIISINIIEEDRESFFE